MKKQKIKYVCTNCGHESLRWIGKCPDCDSWNSFHEEIVESKQEKILAASKDVYLKNLKDISIEKEERIKTNIDEFDRVFGGGIIKGSVVLIGGDPGIGKSTLMLQAAAKMKCKVLYVTGEESLMQIKLRANRLNIKNDNLLLLSETDLNVMLSVIKNEAPSVVIIDSIQTTYDSRMENAAGTVTQIRESTARLMEDAKKNNYSAIIIGHITKEGTIAGPKILEHIVDAVIQFEGDANNYFRILRAQKNRFGSTNEIGIFEMHEEGLKEVTNPSEIFLSERSKNIPGSSISATIEGTRPLLVEIQALVTPTHFGNPQRVASGFDYRRLSILLAVLEKRCGHKLSAHNVFLNIAGGIKIFEPAVDLAVCCSIASSLLDRVCDNNSAMVGEVGLSGEIRNVNHLERRIQEAEKLGFKRIFVPSGFNSSKKDKSEIKIIRIENLNEAIQLALQ